MAESAPEKVLAAIRRELSRNAARTRNGIKWATGAEFAPPNPTPSDVIWREGKALVRRYRRDSPPQYRTPVLAYMGLVGSPHVFDLYKGGSIVQMLMAAGFDTYMLDWGSPDSLDSQNTLETYLGGYYPNALNAVCEESGSTAVNAFAYCMGGMMTVHALAAQPDLPIRSLVALAAPFDLSDVGSFVNLMRDGKLEVADIVDETGNIPSSLLRESGKIRKPTGDLVNYANLLENLWNDEYVKSYQAISRFLYDYRPIPGGVAEQMVQMWIRDNAFVNDRLRLHGKRAPLAEVRLPVLGVVAERDDIAPLPAARAMVDVLPNAPAELLEIATGHASLFIGRKAVTVVMPKVFEWIAARSEAVG
jgi:polyhydroxyalkanoate synthase